MNFFNTFKDLLPLFSTYKREMTGEAFKKTASNKLLEKIKKNQIKSEEEAIEYISGNKKNPKGSYWAVAQKTLSILVGNLFLKPTDYQEDYKSVYHECYKKATAVILWRSEGRKTAAESVALITLKKSTRYHITEPSMIMSRELMQIYQMQGNQVEASKYKKLHNHYKVIYEMELSAYSAINEVALLSSRHKKPDEQILSQITSLLDSIKPIEGKPYYLMMMVFRSKVIKATFLNDHSEVFKAYLGWIDYCKPLKFNPPKGHIFHTKLMISPSLIIHQKYDHARKNVNDCLNSRVKGELNWHTSLVHQTILGFHSKDFKLAKESIFLAKNNSEGLAEFITEWWKLAEAHLFFVSLLGKVKFEGSFKVSKFLNELPELSKDKPGANVSIIIIAEFLIHLAQGNRDPLIEKNEAIRLYTYRNLKSTKRSKIFFQILRKISRCSFDPVQFEAGTKAELGMLKNHPIKIEDLETEIIPYEHLYEMIVSILNTQTGVNQTNTSSRYFTKT